MPIDEPPTPPHHEVRIAQGLIAGRLGVTLDEADAAIRSYASLAAAPLDAVARDIIELQASAGPQPDSGGQHAGSAERSDIVLNGEPGTAGIRPERV